MGPHLATIIPVPASLWATNKSTTSSTYTCLWTQTWTLLPPVSARNLQRKVTEHSRKILNAQRPLPIPAIVGLLHTQLKPFNMTFPIYVSASSSSETPVGSIPFSQCLAFQPNFSRESGKVFLITTLTLLKYPTFNLPPKFTIKPPIGSTMSQ